MAHQEARRIAAKLQNVMAITEALGRFRHVQTKLTVRTGDNVVNRAVPRKDQIYVFA